MNINSFFLFLLSFGLLFSCNQPEKSEAAHDQPASLTSNPLIGKWVKNGPMGPIGLHFKEDGTVEGDFGQDNTIDIVSQYELNGDTIRFMDKEGKTCPLPGSFKMYQGDGYFSFDLIEDDCAGRVQMTMGFWTKPNYQQSLEKLDRKIEATPEDMTLHLHRARMYLAIGNSEKAKSDFDRYILSDTTDARVYVNRAGTRFPNDMAGVILDCNKSIAIDSSNKNAYFLRGLAYASLGKQKQACNDYAKAIELGFAVLKNAEQEKCAAYWDENQAN